jgi:hypothetical protein
LAPLGRRDDYAPDGVVLGAVIDPAVLPSAMLRTLTAQPGS